MKSRTSCALAAAAGLMLGAAPAAPPTFTITLGGRTACVTPTTKHFARADGGSIDVQDAAQGVLTANLSGCVASNSNLAHTGTAVESLHLVQEFEITCSDTNVSAVALTLDSSLVGFVRSKYKGRAYVYAASATVTYAGHDASPLATAYEPISVTGTDARLCNQHNEPVTARSLPLGKYVLTADFAIGTEASGLCDGHSAADFSPTAALPADFVRLRDPFQNVDKKDFGFSITLSATATDDTLTSRPTVDARAAHTSLRSAKTTVSNSKPQNRTAFDAARAPFNH